MNKQRLVFFDLDGTLLTHNKQVHEYNKNIILDLQKNHNFIFCIATGRNLNEGILTLIEELNLKHYIVFGNGNFIYDILNKTVITIGNNIDFKIVKKFYKFAKKFKCQLNIYFHDATFKSYYFGNNIYEEIKDPLFYSIGPNLDKFSSHKDIKNDLCKKIVHLGIKSEPKIITKLFPKINKYKNKIQISNILNIYIDAESIGISKWTGIQYVQNKLHIENKNTYAFGDSLNDWDMLKNVGNPICMGNSDPILKTHFNTIIGDHNTNAIGLYLNSIIDNQGKN